MSLKEQLMDDLKSAMKEKNTIKKNVVTMIRAAILQYEKDNKCELDDEGIRELVAKQLKQRKDALVEFERGKRQDLVEQTESEINIILSYLPAQLTENELKDIVKEAITRLNITDLKQMGKIMGDVMPKVKGRADGKAINEAAKEILSGN